MARNKTFTPTSTDAHSKGKLYDPRTPGLMIEVMPSGNKIWKYERCVTGDGTKVGLSFGQFPACSMSDAREWAAALNDQVGAGIDPREAMREEKARASMTAARAHALYMAAAREGRASRAAPRAAIPSA